MKLAELLGKKLKEIRESKNLTQQDFAEICDMHPTTIGMIEIGKRKPSLRAIEVFVEKLNIDYSDLFDFKNEYTLEKSDNELKLELGRVVNNFNKAMLKHMIAHAKSIKELLRKK